MTTQQALLAMKIGCKIRADWMKPELFYYIKGDKIFNYDDSSIYCKVCVESGTPGTWKSISLS